MTITTEINAINTTPHKADTTGWSERHIQAWKIPRKTEKPIVSLFNSLCLYADKHKQRFDSDLSEDYFLGKEWLTMVLSLRALLNGDLGRLDGGTLDKSILRMIELAGFDLEEEGL